jgi:Mrp family chromosome partitioning ATPase
MARAALRFGRVVLLCAAAGPAIMGLYALATGPTYAATAGLVITPPPANLQAFPGSNAAATRADNLDRQIAILESSPVTDAAAQAVDQTLDAHLTEQQLAGDLAVTTQSGVAPITSVTVTMGNAPLAAGSANAVVTSYMAAARQDLKTQAQQSIDALSKRITTVTNQLKALPTQASSLSPTTLENPLTDTGTATIPTSTSTSTSSASDAGTRSALVATLSDLTRARTQVEVNEQTDLNFETVVHQADTPTDQTNTTIWQYLLIGLFLGLILGLASAYVLARTRPVFDRAAQPSSIYNIPLLATIPAFGSSGWLQHGLPILSEPFEAPAEGIRTLATTIRSTRPPHQSRLLTFSAAAPRAGTTTMVANVGLALAEMGERVLVIDGDPVGRGLTRRLTESGHVEGLLNPRPGFSEVICGRALLDSIVPADADGRLKVLTSGMDPDLALTRWSARWIELAFNDAKDHFDFILIDVPPLGSSYGMDLAGTAAAILVVPYLDSVKHHLSLPARIEAAGIRLLGYVFTAAPASGHFVPYFPVLHSAGTRAGGHALPASGTTPSPLTARPIASSPPELEGLD